jgi:chromosomal replication initiator protein
MQKDCIEVWDNCLKSIKEIINHQSFKTWFLPIKPVKLKDNVLTILLPSQFFYEWLEEHYIGLVKKIIKKELGTEGRLEYSIIMDNTEEELGPYTVNIPTGEKQAIVNPSVSIPIDLNRGYSKEIHNPFIIPGLKKIRVNPQLIESNSFENFVEGDCNRLARSAGYAVANNPGNTSFNPLLIYSGTGLGKTHLSHSIGLQVKNNFPEKTVLYVTTDQFINQFIDSVKNNNQNDFIHFYQMIDVLIIDDIHNLSGKDKAQDVFFHIFNHLHQKSKQIVLTSNKPPVEMKDIEPRLLSRFKWGLSADLQIPDLETRIAILHKKLYNDGIEIPQEVVEYLAYSINTNVKLLNGILISMLALSSLNKNDITVDFAKQVIHKFANNISREISIDYIQKVVCDYFNIPVEMIHSKTRKRKITQARQLSMYFSRKYTKSAVAIIGLHCGDVSHVAVLHACHKVDSLFKNDDHFKQIVEELDRRIKK